MNVHVVVIDPEGSVGGFEWRKDEADAELVADQLRSRGVPLLGTIEVGISDEHLSNEDVTNEIDSMLPELERTLAAAASGPGEDT